MKTLLFILAWITTAASYHTFVAPISWWVILAPFWAPAVAVAVVLCFASSIAIIHAILNPKA